MDKALSIALGGELLAPSDCDYTSYNRLGLVCPVCNNPVYLVSASEVSTHTRKEKTITGFSRNAHFSHFYEKDRLSECENRSAVSDIERVEHNTVARNQRLAVFVGSFCEILELNPRLLEINKAPRVVVSILTDALKNEVKALSVYSIFATRFWQYLKTNQQTIGELMPKNNLQEKISLEAFNFMISDEGKKVVAIMFWYIYYFGGKGDVEKLTNNILTCTGTTIIEIFDELSLTLVEILLETPWIEGFSNLQNR